MTKLRRECLSLLLWAILEFQAESSILSSINRTTLRFKRCRDDQLVRTPNKNQRNYRDIYRLWRAHKFHVPRKVPHDTAESSYANPIGCGTMYLNFTAIINGTVVKDKYWPWAVYLTVGCGGTLIDRWWVVTAADCIPEKIIKDPVKNKLYMKFGRQAARRPGDKEQFQFTTSAKKIYIHSMFTYLNDTIALIKVRQKVSQNARIYPICVPQVYDVMRDISKLTCYVTGFGQTNISKTTPTGPSYMTSLKYHLRETADCQVNFYRPWASPNFFCGEPSPNNSTELGYLCRGDAGGPVMCRILEEAGNQYRYFLWGVVNMADRCSPKTFGLYYDSFAGIILHMNWIKEQVIADSGRVPYWWNIPIERMSKELEAYITEQAERLNLPPW